MGLNYALPVATTGTTTLEFDYINYKNELSHRRVIYVCIGFGNSEWHKEPQWLMRAFDIDKKETREFSMKSMTNVQPGAFLRY